MMIVMIVSGISGWEDIRTLKVSPSSVTLEPFQSETFTWRYSPENLDNISDYEVDPLASTGNLSKSMGGKWAIQKRASESTRFSKQFFFLLSCCLLVCE